MEKGEEELWSGYTKCYASECEAMNVHAERCRLQTQNQNARRDVHYNTLAVAAGLLGTRNSSG